MTEERPWTAEEAADYLSRSAETVRRMARRGELVGEKIGRDWRFRPEAVRAVLRAPAQAATAGLSEAAQDLMAHVLASRERARLRARTG